METRSDEIPILLQQTYDDDPGVRWRALIHLCPCHVKRNHEQVWNRAVAMATDADPKVRDRVLHVLTDGSPRSREPEVVGVLERMHHDPDPKLRRKARRILAHYRRTGDWNIS
ncbi:MAG TPA: HEAT repeat domain-containing protein [Chloroflexota bacterium]|jgi:hypothetical protein|nr:HEAT repeat domain-containing protein [Chloroflexota bacterium]